MIEPNFASYRAELKRISPNLGESEIYQSWIVSMFGPFAITTSQIRGDSKQYHFVYITVRDDGKIYVGKHSTDDMNDGYGGSGLDVKKSMAEGHTFTPPVPLEFFPTQEDAYAREKDIVNNSFITETADIVLNRVEGGKDAHYKKQQAASYYKAQRIVREFSKSNNWIDLLLLPNFKIGTRLYIDCSKPKFFGTVVNHNTVDILGNEFSIDDAAKVLTYCIEGEVFEDVDSLKSADGKDITVLWDAFCEENPSADINESKVNNPEFAKYLNPALFMNNGDELRDKNTGCIGKWVDVKTQKIQFNDSPAMTLVEWINSTHTTKNMNYKHFVDVKSGKTLDEMRAAEFIRLADDIKKKFEL